MAYALNREIGLRAVMAALYDNQIYEDQVKSMMVLKETAMKKNQKSKRATTCEPIAMGVHMSHDELLTALDSPHRGA